MNQAKDMLIKKTKVKAPIIEALKKYYQNPATQFHIPGHTKGNAILPEFQKLIGKKATFLDSTDEFNNLGTLHPATGAIKEAQDLAAKAFNAKKTFFLVAGSTIGNLAIASTLTKQNQKVIIGRNCHRSIITGIINSGAQPLWAIPEKIDNWGLWGEIRPKEVETLLQKNPDTSLVWITSPTYEGVVSDVEAISKICQKYNVPLAVDEAHGCLWSFNEKFPTPAIQSGADIVVQSLHKTGGSFSQSSMMHVAKKSKIDLDKLDSNLRLLHTTSPSCTLLASLDASRAYLQSAEGAQRIQDSLDNALFLRERLQKNLSIKLLQDEAQIDLTKIFINIKNLSGLQLETILKREYNIEIESAANEGVLVLSNIGNTRAEMEYLAECLESIVNSNFAKLESLDNERLIPLCIPKMIMSPREAHSFDSEKLATQNTIGRICAEVIAECPPGISILVPGELIEEKHIPYLKNYQELRVIKD